MSEVEEQNKQLELVNESLNQFAYIASHDLQEPLRKIQQFAAFLDEDLGKTMNDESQYHLDVIVKSATRMSTLIQDLLEFSSAAKGGLEKSDINLNELLEEVRAELDFRVVQSDATINVGTLPTVQGDPSLVRQLFTNLISNSIKYRHDDRAPVVHIAIGSNADKSDELASNLVELKTSPTTISISDNGIGFDQSLIARAFEPFNRLHTDKKYSGNGIGLSICATVCDKHGWTLSATSEPGVGSVFTITIETSD